MINSPATKYNKLLLETTDWMIMITTDDDTDMDDDNDDDFAGVCESNDNYTTQTICNQKKIYEKK